MFHDSFQILLKTNNFFIDLKSLLLIEKGRKEFKFPPKKLLLIAVSNKSIF